MTHRGDPPMDYMTAFAFAAEAFERAHPKTTWPPWLWRYAMRETYTRDRDRNFLVGYVWKPRASKSALCFFEVKVNPWNGDTEVMTDTPLDTYRPEDLEEYG